MSQNNKNKTRITENILENNQINPLNEEQA
jgi:hypothetical protein